MKTITKCSLSLLAVCVSGVLHAADTTPTWPERSPIVFWGDRANEDWSYVDNIAEDDKSFSEKLKRLDISEDGDWKVSFSGNVKASFDNRWNHMYDPEVRKHNEFRSRLQFATDVTYQDWMRLYGEIRTNYTNLDSPGPVDDAGTDFHQLFAEFKLLDDGEQFLSTRLGRQEIYLNEWQMMNREPTPVQNSWNAISAKYKVAGINFDAYYGEEIFPVRGDKDWSGNWDDKTNGKKSTGLFANWRTSFGAMQAYVMSNELTNSSFVNAPHGDVDIQVLGLHAHDFVSEGFGYMVDGIYQFGDQAGKDISAYMAYADLNYNWKTDWNYRVGINLHYASGSDKNSDKVNTFNPLWTGDPLGFAHDGAYGNAMQFGGYSVIEYMPKQSIITGFMSTWRANTEDAIYTLNQDVLYGADSDEKYAYTQFYLQFHNYLTPNLKSEVNTYYALASDYTDDVVSPDSKDIARIELALIYNF
ncbi:alginate export family protein [Vibrio scophthalmi]|uniref:Alginate export domain-containing protein n=2 Tax=Vibrio scophthalmi TaxID=45658 RepID=A0A1C7FH77_9VIBR|nr:alginate export family protein [Vibrio scophthalmi]ANU39067.1 hypothetical protein VSVS05_04031 [Vibrio scophthalmi]EGU36214.1 hypothetical protein VIS19158_03437 [Vibrio scophthalmi LMG 19158]MCY9802401.1 alginate export family protein [Vibrio scophthalmi]ODS05409.1 hypothetical protein VSF3289_04550 [Vibrio scophthalmi]